jgi:leucyl-tRNA synthetase
MAEKYDHKTIETKWQKRWEETRLYQVDLQNAQNPFYNLMEFPYPSSEALHVGHAYTYGGADSYGRLKRMRGYEVFEPIGFDAFGIHTENYALKVGIHPAIITAQNVERYRGQIKRIGAMFDWSREVVTCSPEYYRWTQWVFVQLFRMGLVVRKEAPVNWCPSCLTVLANEQVINGLCERCDTEVIQRVMVQWFLKITDYADRLLAGHETVDWPEVSVKMQRNWIGRSEGATIVFTVDGCDEEIEVFTSRPDTLFGATYVVLAPEHPSVDRITKEEHWQDVMAYRQYVMKEKEVERLSLDREKTGIMLGAWAVNPVNGQHVPIWIADYVLAHYGTGAIMAVPAHDQRDYEFATKFGLPIIEVVKGNGDIEDAAYEGQGTLINSGQFSGLPSEEGGRRIVQWLSERECGRVSVSYRLHDWLVSRQRYWGTPIPIVHCSECGHVAVPEDELPVLLPELEDFRPKGTGKSPLSQLEEWVNTTCPQCGGPAQRETDVCDTFLDSAWYFLRYPSTHRTDRPFDRELIKRWLPVDMYMGGPEHTTMHHLYARFVNMALYDGGHIDIEEPFARLRLHGTLIKDGAKMSKSRGNVVNPDEYIEEHGADVFRMYLFFMGPFEEGGDFSDRGISGIARFVNRVWSIVLDEPPPPGKGLPHLRTMHRTIKRVTQDIENLKFNTAISALMEYVHWIEDQMQDMTSDQVHLVTRNLALLLAPLAPHLAEELWERIGGSYSVHSQSWPEWDEVLLAAADVTVVIQVNGKLKEKVVVPSDTSQDEVETAARELPKVQEELEGRKVVKIVYIPGRILNFVVK